MAFQKTIGGPSFQGMGNPARPAQGVESAVPTLLNAGLQAAETLGARREAALEAQDEAQQRQVVADYTLESIDRSLEAHPAVQQATSQLDRTRLPDGDIVALNQAAEQAERLNIMAQQTGNLDFINYQKLSQHRRYLAQFPHLTPELNKLFKDNQGTGIMGYADESFERESAEAEAQREREQQQLDAQRQARFTAINTALTASGLVPPANPEAAEQLFYSSGAAEQWGKLQQGTQVLQGLQQRNDITSEQRKTNELKAAEDVLPNLHLESQAAISALATGGTLQFDETGAPTVVGGSPDQGFNPETDQLSPEQLQQIDLYINSLRNYAATAFRETREDVLPMIETQLEFAQKFRNYYAGEVTQQTLQAQQTLMQTLARRALPSESYDIEALGEVFKNIPDGLMSAAAQNRLLQEGFGQLTVNLGRSLQKKDEEPEDAFDGIRIDLPETEQAVREVAVSISKGMNSPEFTSDSEVRDTFGRTLESITVRMGQNPQNLPPGLYEAAGEAFANPKVIDVLNEYEGLTARNAQIGYAEYARTMRESLMEDLELDLGPQTVPAAERRTTGAALFEQDDISMRVDRAGNLVFSANDPEDRSAASRASRLQRKYGRRFARLNKIYSHVVEFNTDYAANANFLAAQMLNGGNSLTRAFQFGREAEQELQGRAEEAMRQQSELPSGNGLRADEMGDMSGATRIPASQPQTRQTSTQPASRGDVTPAAGGVDLGQGDERAQTQALFDMIDEGASVQDVEAQFDALGIPSSNAQRQKIMRRVRAYATQ